MYIIHGVSLSFLPISDNCSNFAIRKLKDRNERADYRKSTNIDRIC
jgi:hypothetical protein